jgi:hypothetical protein
MRRQWFLGSPTRILPRFERFDRDAQNPTVVSDRGQIAPFNFPGTVYDSVAIGGVLIETFT